jgi:hypothetical protein
MSLSLRGERKVHSQLPNKLQFLDISCHLCYNTPDATGKQVRFLHEPVAVKRTLGYAEQGSVLPLAAKEEQGHWETIALPRRPTARRPVEIPEHPAKTAEHSRENRDDRLGGKSFYFKGEKQT